MAGRWDFADGDAELSHRVDAAEKGLAIPERRDVLLAEWSLENEV